MCRELTERDAITADGHLRAGARIHVPPPRSVRAALVERLARLDDDDAQLLQVAAVHGVTRPRSSLGPPTVVEVCPDGRLTSCDWSINNGGHDPGHRRPPPPELRGPP
jgi:hypothetical protein